MRIFVLSDAGAWWILEKTRLIEMVTKIAMGHNSLRMRPFGGILIESRSQTDVRTTDVQYKPFWWTKTQLETNLATLLAGEMPLSDD